MQACVPIDFIIVCTAIMIWGSNFYQIDFIEYSSVDHKKNAWRHMSLE